VRIPGECLEENVWVDVNARFHPTALIEGPVVLGRDALIGQEATLSDNVTVGPGCRVHPGATIKRSILLSGSSVGEGAYLEDCIVGLGYDVRSGEQIRGGALVRGVRRKDQLPWAPSGSAA
jgi:NDP-sugar pyrophosphorylase family protein